MKQSLPKALKLMFGDEGGYANRSTDAGGPTKYGITQKTLAAERGHSVTAADVKALTLSEAEAIYRKSYWSQSGGDILPVGLDYAAFDFGVNSGPNRAVKVLQQVIGVTPDGWIGPETLRAVEDYAGGIEQLISDYCDARMSYLRSLTSKKTGFPVNGRGWTIRVTGIDPLGKFAKAPGVVGNALAMARGEAVKAKPDPVPAGGDAKAAPKPENPWTKPEVILPGAGTVLGGLGTLFSGNGPTQYALAFVVVLAGLIGAFMVFRLIKARPA